MLVVVVVVFSVVLQRRRQDFIAAIMLFYCRLLISDKISEDLNKVLCRRHVGL